VDRGLPGRAHFDQPHPQTGPGELPSGLAPGETSANDKDFFILHAIVILP